MIPKEKKQILDSFIENIACFADDQYQERVWIRADGPECDDIDDAICDFFDEDYILDRYKEYGINEDQYNLLIDLYEKLKIFKETFNVYSSEKSTEKLIRLPQWQEIRDLSKKIIKSFSTN